MRVCVGPLLAALLILAGCATAQPTVVNSEECRYFLPGFFGTEDQIRAIRQGNNFHAVEVHTQLEGPEVELLSFAELAADADVHWYRLGGTAYMWVVGEQASQFDYAGYAAGMRAAGAGDDISDSFLHPAPTSDAVCEPVDAPPIVLPAGVVFQVLDPSTFNY